MRRLLLLLLWSGLSHAELPAELPDGGSGLDGGSAAHYAASYWYFTRTIPAAGPQGTWTFEATFEGQVSTHAFQVIDGNLADGFENPML